ncbi:hypothetical protein SDC9_128288 [bioreactor metagenome]|uniref:Uncharacterized protein n=1 Tax=bioreactor metagenome TaxID=1076179 RepID=A0A645CVS8_9ZZZZ
MDQRDGAGGGGEAEGGTRRVADHDDPGQVGHVELARVTGGQHQPHDVLGDQVVHEDM